MELFYMFGFIGILILVVLFFIENYSDKQFHREVLADWGILDGDTFKEIRNINEVNQ